LNDAKLILHSLEPVVRKCTVGNVKEDGFFIMSVRAALAKNYEVNRFIHTREASADAFIVTSALRGMCEDIIALKWLATFEKRDRDEAVGVMMMKSVLEFMQQQTAFFGKYRPCAECARATAGANTANGPACARWPSRPGSCRCTIFSTQPPAASCTTARTI
jgi:hypothetical protein